MELLTNLHADIRLAQEQLMDLSQATGPINAEDVQIIEVAPGMSADLQPGLACTALKSAEANRVVLVQPGNLRFMNLRLVFRGSNNVIVISPPLDPGGGLAGYVRFESNHGLAYINEGQQIVAKLSVVLWSPSNKFIWGNGSTSNGTTVETSGDGKQIVVGRDCMFAAETWLRNYDQHAIVDLASSRQLNSPIDVTLGEHVWVGQCSAVYGAQVGKGAIVGAYSMVRENVEPCSVVAGVPARVVRKQASWTRAPFPSSDEVARLLAFASHGGAGE